MNIFCIIPARGGSKGVPRKNVRPFLGKPLIEHSIEYALSTELVSQVFVSTDDPEISSIASAAGASIIQRPENISGDTASTETAIQHAMAWWASRELSPDIIVLLQATSPLRPPGSLENALLSFVDGHYDSMLSISPTHRFFWRIDDDEAFAEYDYANRPRRQDMTEADIRYVENGSLYIFTADHFRSVGNRLGGRIGYTLFPEAYSPEIDTLSDFLLLESIAQDLAAD